MSESPKIFTTSLIWKHPMWLIAAFSTFGVIEACGSASEAADPKENESNGGISEVIHAFFDAKPKAALNCEELGEWWKTNADGLTVTHTRPNYRISLEYHPAACAACREQRGARFADTVYQQRVAELRESELYVIKLYTGKDLADTATLALGMLQVDQVQEIVGADTVPCAFMHVEAMPSMMPYRSVVIGFERRQDGKDRHIILRDNKELFGGDLIFRYHAGVFENYLSIAPDSLTTATS